MKKFGVIVAGLLAAPALAFASQAGVSPSEEKGSEAMQGSEAIEEGQAQRASLQTFEAQKNFEIDGVLGSVQTQSRKVTIQRQKEGLPPVELTLAQDAKIELDGAKASLTELQPGSEVRATFNVAGSSIVGLELEAKKAVGSDSMKPEEKLPAEKQPSTPPIAPPSGGSETY